MFNTCNYPLGVRSKLNGAAEQALREAGIVTSPDDNRTAIEIMEQHRNLPEISAGHAAMVDVLLDYEQNTPQPGLTEV